MRILVVDDELELADAIVEVLTDDAYAVDHAADGKQAQAMMASNSYDLVLLDRKIPPPTGEQLLSTWRSEGRDTPVLVLTGTKTSVGDTVEGLDLGADDYLTKPFAFAELRARVRSLLRRREKSVHAEMKAGDLTMDRSAHTVTIEGRAIELAPKEFALLEYLLVRQDVAVSRGELGQHVWDDSYTAGSNVIDVMIHRLRKKIDSGKAGKLLHTVPGVGYILKSERC